VTVRVTTDASEFREATVGQDSEVKFGGRTLVVHLVFHTIVDPVVISERVREVVAGPKLRMVVGTASSVDGGVRLTSYVNTDEDVLVVRARVLAIAPRPASARVDEVAPTLAAEVWAQLHRFIDGGD
jgi:hypothetical protein